MVNDIGFLHSTITRLQKNGIKTLVFGGWAEELMNAIAPRPHYDVDLLYFADDFAKIDEFLSKHPDLEEIELKRFSHKRAFLSQGIMVELILLREENEQWVTDLWSEYRLEWPRIIPVNVAIPSVGEMWVADPSLVYFYQSHFPAINAVRNRHLAEIRCGH